MLDGLPFDPSTALRAGRLRIDGSMVLTFFSMYHFSLAERKMIHREKIKNCSAEGTKAPAQRLMAA